METMPFGKYKGRPLSELPDSYLEWLLDLPDLRPRLAAALADEMDRRHKPPPKPPVRLKALDPVIFAVVQRIVQAGYRQVSMLEHPDRGGTVRGMQNVNGAKEALDAVMVLLKTGL